MTYNYLTIVNLLQNSECGRSHWIIYYKPFKLCILNGWIVWHINYISVKLKKLMKVATLKTLKIYVIISISMEKALAKLSNPFLMKLQQTRNSSELPSLDIGHVGEKLLLTSHIMVPPRSYLHPSYTSVMRKFWYKSYRWSSYDLDPVGSHFITNLFLRTLDFYFSNTRWC